MQRDSFASSGSAGDVGFHSPASSPPLQHLRYEVAVAKGIVTVKFGKRLTIAEIEQYADTLRNDPAFHPGFSEIVDLREIEEVDLKADDFLRLADQIDPFLPTARRAFVVKSTVQTHAARMHKILRSEKSIEIFETLEEAECWIAQRPPLTAQAHS